MAFGQDKLQTESSERDAYSYLNTFAEVYELVRDQYVEEISDQELMEAAISGMLQKLDPHSSYINEASLKDLQEQTSGKFGGLGIKVTMQDELVLVISPIDNTPADRAGIMSGDLISHIDDFSIRGLGLREIVERMRGEIGTSIELTIIREDTDPFKVDLTREAIIEDPIVWQRIDDMGYVRIRTFSEQTHKHLESAIAQLHAGLRKEKDSSPSKHPLRGFVVDLRNNPGGLLKQAILVTDAFLDAGEIVSTKGRDKKRIQRYQASKGDLTDGFPLVVLINSGSASASEIVAGALQDHQRAIIVGTPSFGKGSVQNIIPLETEIAAVRLTIQLYYSPSGDTIQAVGVKPDVYVEQADLVPVAVSVLPYSEASTDGALPNAGETEDDTEIISAETMELLANDYQLSRAIDVLKVMSLVKSSAGL